MVIFQRETGIQLPQEGSANTTADYGGTKYLRDCEYPLGMEQFQKSHRIHIYMNYCN